MTILELLGTRIIGPFCGVSLYVWSSLIAVTLVALVLGYYCGRYPADRCPAFRLPLALPLVALATTALPYIRPCGGRPGDIVSVLWSVLIRRCYCCDGCSSNA